MRVVLVEFPWHVKKILSNKSSFEKDVIVSLDPESSYELKINNIAYYETYQFCNHRELWLKYKDITEHTINITKILDQALWKMDKRFQEINWQLFDDYHYPLKISFDQLFYYSNLILKLIEKFNPTEIIISDSDKIIIDEDLLINTKISIIKFLLETFEDPHNKVKISFISTNQPKKTTFYNAIKESAFFNVKKKIRNTYHKINFLINYYVSKPKYLSVGSFEIQRYKKLYPKDAELFLSYNHNNSKKIKINNIDFSNKFINYLRNETNFYEQIKFENISFGLIFNEILIKILKRLDFIFYEYNKAKKILNRIKPKCVIFNSMTPFYIPTLTFRKNCINLKIPFVTWSHGGYGLTYSLASYDITDFRLCKNHISYGEYLKDLVSNNECVLKKLGFQKDQKILPVGSPRFDYENRKKKLSKKIKKKDKPTILFMMGVSAQKNRFYFGRNREKTETSIWEFQHEILSVLKKYQNKYNIIFKDYPNGYKGLWKKILTNINADKIFYVSNEYKVNDLLRISDLNIVPWISTTFFESLYFDADIFVIEEDMFEKPFKEELKDEIFYFKDSKIFLLELEKYLETGDFYTRNKKNSKNYLLKLDAINRRDELLKDALSKIN